MKAFIFFRIIKVYMLIADTLQMCLQFYLYINIVKTLNKFVLFVNFVMEIFIYTSGELYIIVCLSLFLYIYEQTAVK